MAATLGAPVPILRSFDEARARAFYLDYLGFSVDWEHRFEPALPLYMQLSRDGCLLHLSEHHGDACPGAALRIACADLPALHAELRAKVYGCARPGIVETPWETREMTLHDPFGSRLVFIDTPKDAPAP